MKKNKTMINEQKIIAVDFDGTLAETDFPKIIKPNLRMITFCKQLQKQGCILILWTCRCGRNLEDALKFCEEYNLKFDYVNENAKENIKEYGNDSRKIFAHEYIDDRTWSPARESMWGRSMRKLQRRAKKQLVIAYVIAIILCFATIFILRKFEIL